MHFKTRQQLESLRAAPKMPDMSLAIMERINASKNLPARKDIGIPFPKWLTRKRVFAYVPVLIAAVLLVGIISTTFIDNDKALATEIVKGSHKIQTALNGVNMGNTKIIDMTQQSGCTFIILQREQDAFAVAWADRETKEVIQVWDWKITKETTERVKSIASTNPDVQELLEQGAGFSYFTPSYSPVILQDDQAGTAYVERIELIAIAVLEYQNNRYEITVNLDREEVTGVVVLVALQSWQTHRWFLYGVLAVVLILNIVVIIGIANKKDAAIKAAGGLSVLSGMVGVYSMLTVFNKLSVAFFLFGLPVPVLGLGVGILSMKKKRSSGNKLVAIIGMLLCVAVLIFTVLFLLAQITGWAETSAIPM